MSPTGNSYLLGAVSLLALMSARHVDAQAAPATASAPDAPKAQTEVEAIVVTGSRLTGNFNSPTPVTTISAETISQRAPTLIIETLADLPSLKPDSGPGQGQRVAAAASTSTADLRGLGSGRTLTLVDGRRQVSLFGGNGAGGFDTNRIPVNLLDRVEIVTGGASAAYGSDAVAGVVNFIINDRLNGMRASADYGISQRGDNVERNLSFAAGGGYADDRGHSVFGIDYTKDSGIGTLYARPYGALEPGLLTEPANRPAGVPAQVWASNVEFATINPGGIVTSGPLKGTAFDANGQPYAFQYGTVFSTLMTGSNANYGGSNLGTFYLVQPLERLAAMARTRFEATPALTLFADASYSRVHSTGQAAVIQFPTVTILSSNPFIPAATKAAMTAAGVTSINLGFAANELNPRGTGASYITDNHAETVQMNVGARGTIFHGWKWDVTFSDGQIRTNANTLDAPYGPNFLAATDVIAGPAGAPVCAPIATNPNLNAAQRALVLPGCVPFNIFGTKAASQDAIHYVAVKTHSLNTTQLQDISANISGSPFSDWAGPVSVAGGVEHRWDSLSNIGEGYDNTAFAFSGTTTYFAKDQVTEGYLEAGVPLLRNAPIAKAFDLNGAIRRTHYSTSGDVTTWKAGFTYDLVPELRFRGTLSRDIRAPNIYELFNVGGQGSLNNVRNPFNNQTGTPLSQGSGNPNLKPEIAKTVTAGIVFQPSWGWTSNFRASIDYYHIAVSGVVASVSAVDIINRCYAGITSYCSAITFDNSTFGIHKVTTATYNLNTLTTEGVDADLSYRVPLSALPLHVPGRLGIDVLGSYQPQLTTIDLTGLAINRAGSGQGVPKWRWTVNFDYATGPFNALLQMKYTGHLIADPTLVGPDSLTYNPAAPNSVSQNRFPASFYFDLAAQYNIHPIGGYAFQLFGNVDNLFDTQPPLYSAVAFSGVGGQFEPYDLVGRMFKIGVRVSR